MGGRMPEFIRRFFYLIGDVSKKSLLFLIVSFFALSLFDVIGLGGVGAFLVFMLDFNKTVQKMPDFLQGFLLHFSQIDTLSFIAVGLIFAFISKAFIGIIVQRRVVFFVSRVTAFNKSRLLRLYQEVDYSFHLKENSAYALNSVRLIDYFANRFLLPSLYLVSSLLIVFTLLLVLFIGEPKVTLGMFLIFASLIGLYSMMVRRKLAELGKTMATVGGDLNKHFLQALHGTLEIRIFGKELYFFKKLRKAANEYAFALAYNTALQQMPRYILESGVAVALIIVLLGGLLLGLSAKVIIPVVAVFSAACLRLLPTINLLIASYSQLQESAYSVKTLCQNFMDLERHRDLSIALNNNALPKLNSLDIQFNGVGYQYPGTGRDVLSNISLTIKKGQSVGFMGTSGAGKSTLLNILLGVLTPSCGNILIGNKQIEDVKRSWIGHCAYIPQKIFLLDDTLRKNIALGVEPDAIDVKKLEKALEMAQLLEVIENLPDGVDTMLGENGIRLSGGQRQRVALARAFYYERDIIIMDEATSALDNQTENEVIEAIKKLHGEKTLIIVAHRLSTLQYCDVVYRLEKGQIVNEGSFSELVV